MIRNDDKNVLYAEVLYVHTGSKVGMYGANTENVEQ